MEIKHGAFSMIPFTSDVQECWGGNLWHAM